MKNENCWIRSFKSLLKIGRQTEWLQVTHVYILPAMKPERMFVDCKQKERKESYLLWDISKLKHSQSTHESEGQNDNIWLGFRIGRF